MAQIRVAAALGTWWMVALRVVLCEGVCGVCRSAGFVHEAERGRGGLGGFTACGPFGSRWLPGTSVVGPSVSATPKG